MDPTKNPHPARIGFAAATVIAAGLAAAVPGAAEAATVDGAAGSGVTTLYEGTSLIGGVSFSRMELKVPSAGQLTVSLRDLAFPALAGALSFAVVQNGTVLGVVNGTGSLSLSVPATTNLFAYVYGVGAPLISSASYYLNVTHSMDANAPVPLPPALWMLVSGLGLSGWFGVRRTQTGSSTPAAA